MRGAQALGSLKIYRSELHFISTSHPLHKLGVAEFSITETPLEFKLTRLHMISGWLSDIEYV